MRSQASSIARLDHGARGDQLVQRDVEELGSYAVDGDVALSHRSTERPGAPDDPVADRSMPHRLEHVHPLDLQRRGAGAADPGA